MSTKHRKHNRRQHNRRNHGQPHNRMQRCEYCGQMIVVMPREDPDTIFGEHYIRHPEVRAEMRAIISQGGKLLQDIFDAWVSDALGGETCDISTMVSGERKGAISDQQESMG